MLIRSIEIDNYRVIRSARIVLPEAVIGIIGPNGAGKTSLIEAIAWSLYGTGAARSGKDQIASEAAAPDEPCRVAVTFEIHGATYVVDRRLVGRSRRPEVTVCDRAGTLLSTGVSDSGAFVARLFGLDFKGFLTSFLARQQELNALSDLVPSKRREHLATMLGVDRLDRAISELRSDSRVQQAEIGGLQANLEHRATLVSEIEALSKRLTELEKARTEASGARDQARQTLDATSTAFKAEQARKDQCSLIEATLQGARSSLKHLQERQLQLEHETTELARLTQRAAELKTETSSLEQLRRHRDQLLDRKKSVTFSEELDRQLADLSGRRETATRQCNEYKTQEGSLAEQLGRLPEDLGTQVSELELRLERARGEYPETVASLRAAESELARLTERLEDMTAVGESATCDRCGRSFGDDLPSIREHFQSEAATCRAEITRLTRTLVERKTTGERLAAELKEGRQKLEQQRDGLRQLESVRSRIAETTAQATDLASQQQSLADKRAALPTEPFDPAALAAAVAEVARLEKLATEFNQLVGRLERRTVVEEERVKTATMLETTAREIEELDRRKSEIGFEPARFAALAQELEAEQVLFEKQAARAADCEREHEVAIREREIKQKQLADFAETESRLERMREEVFYGEKLQSVFKLFRSSVMANIRPSLASISGRLMADMTDGKYSLIELDSDYNLQVMDNGRFYPIERFSGGEKDLANLCLRLAISQALTDAAGIDSAFVILDEIFGSQDDGRRELIFDGLAGLKRRFSQIVLVTHIEEIKNRVECLIEVRPGASGGSEVIVHA